MKTMKPLFLAFCLVACLPGTASAITFSQDTLLTPPADGLYNFTDVLIPTGVRVSFAPLDGLTSISWLVDGDAVIAGILDVGGLYDFSLVAKNIRLEGGLLNVGRSIALTAGEIINVASGATLDAGSGVVSVDGGVPALPVPAPSEDITLRSGEFTAIQGIPEPETYALMLAGLGLVGFMARRRSAQV